MENINLEVKPHKTVCDYCKQVIETEIDNQIAEKEMLLDEINKEMEYIEIVKNTHLVCKQLDKMKTIGLGERELILILMDRTKLNMGTIKTLLDALKSFQETEFKDHLDAITNLITNLKKFR